MFLAGLFAGFGWLAMLCLIAGLVSVIIEMFHPGFGAPGIIGAILLITGIIIYSKSLLQALIMFIIIIAILGIALAIVLQSASKGRLARHLVLYDSLEKDSIPSFNGDMEYFLGSEGTTQTILRPAGSADFNGVRLDVVSDGEFIPENTAVKIVKIEGHRIVVKQTI